MKNYLYIILEYFQQNLFETACAILFALLLMGCSSIKEIPIQTIEKITIKDSIIHVHDTITIKLPYEKVVNVVPNVDTSVINTSYAKSVAYLDTASMTINHSLEQKGEIKKPIDTILVTQIKEVEKEKPIPVYVDKPIRDNQFYIYCIYFYFSLLLILIKIYIKFFK